MCLIANSNNPDIAEQDIICYKVYILINCKYVSPFQKCDMPNINELVTTEFQKPGEFFIEKGFHSFAYLKDAENTGKWLESINYYKNCIAKCIIPRGSSYYKGIFNDRYESYCSNSIKLIEICAYLRPKTFLK